MPTLTQEIRDEAFRIGIHKIGVAPAVPLGGEGSRLREWLNQGYHAGMGWMEKNFEKRVDPGKVLSGAKSIIAVAVNYYAPVSHSADEASGKISRYAWGDDYHEI